MSSLSKSRMTSIVHKPVKKDSWSVDNTGKVFGWWGDFSCWKHMWSVPVFCKVVTECAWSWVMVSYLSVSFVFVPDQESIYLALTTAQFCQEGQCDVSLFSFPLTFSSLSFPFFPLLVRLGLCAYVIAHTILPPMPSSPFNLPIELGGRPKRLPLNSGHHRIIEDRGQGRGRRRARWAQGAVRRPFNSCAETKHLGITIIQSLSWTPHVDKLLQCLLQGLHSEAASIPLQLAQWIRYSPVFDPCMSGPGVRWPSLGCLHSFRLPVPRARSIVYRACNSRRKSSITFHRRCAVESWPTLAWRRRWYKLFLFWQLTNSDR